MDQRVHENGVGAVFEPVEAFGPPPSPTHLESVRQQRASTASLQPDGIEGKELTAIHDIGLEPHLRDEYDPYTVPPNFNYAEIHQVRLTQRSHRVLQLQAKFDQDNESLDDYCPCCNYPIDGQLFPLCGNLKKLNELGEGFPLYYDMIQYLCGMLVIVLMVSGVYGLVKNYNADRIADYDSKLSGHGILTGTLGTFYSGNYGHTSVPPLLEPWLHVVSIWVILASYCYLVVRHKRLKKELDFSAITPSDYTVMLTNLPDICTDLDLKEFLEINGRPDGIRCEILKMNLVFRASKLVAARLKQEELKEQLAMAQKLQTQKLSPPLCCFNPVRLSVPACEDALRTCEEAIKFQETKKRDHFTRVAFVTFNQDEGGFYSEAKSVIKYLDRPDITSTWEIVKHVFCPSRSHTTKNVFCGCKIGTKRAPEPSDICWENIGVRVMQVSKKKQYKYRTVTWAATLIVLGASLLAIFFSSNVKSLLSNVYGPSSVSIEDTVAYNILSFLPSLIVILINLILTSIIRYTSTWEKHVTKTSYNTSVAVKQTIAMFLNTAIVSMIIHWGDFYTSKGLAAEMYNIMISNAAVQPIVYWINVPYLLQRFLRKVALGKNQECLMTQKRANKLFEGPALDMPQRYATLLKTYLLTVVYAPMMPLSLAFGILAMLIQYWVDKYMLLRVHARPVRLSHNLDDIMLGFIPAGAIIYACAVWIFFADLDDSYFVPGLVAVVTSVAFFLFPLSKIGRILRLKRNLRLKASVNTLSESEKKYEDAAVDFVDDYDRLNPLTQEEGNQYWVSLIRKKQGEEQAAQVEEALGGTGSKRFFNVLKQRNVLGARKGTVKLIPTAKVRPSSPTNRSMEEEEKKVVEGLNTSTSRPSPNVFLQLMTSHPTPFPHSDNHQ